MSKQRISSLLIVALLPLLAACGAEQASEAPEPASEPQFEAQAETRAEAGDLPPLPAVGFDTERYARDLGRLSSDEFEGRAPGSRGERLTVNHLVGQMAEAGLQPGYGDSYLQPVPMVELTNQARSPIVVETGDESLELNYPEQMITFGSIPTAQAQSVEDSELVFVGYGVVAPEYDWNDYAGLDVAGKTVVMLVNDPGFGDLDSGLFNGSAMTYYGRWTYKYEEAARQGAAAALIVHETEAASYPWEVVINSWSGPQFELAAAGGEPVVPVKGWITRDTALDLFARSGLDFAEHAQAAARPGYQPVPLQARISASVRNSVREGTSYNVLGVLPGSQRPDEVVVYMAHWDHLGRNMAVPGSEGVFNGAIDNASGTAAVLELARMHAAAGAPARSLLFLTVTLEEYGLLGSRHYVNEPAFEPANTVATINLDAFNFMAGPTHDMVVIGYGSSDLDPLLESVLEQEGRRIEPEPTPEAGFYYRSDHFNFARGGIPALYAKSGVDHVEHGAEHTLAAERDYRDNRYHKPGDEFNPGWDFRGVAGDASVLYRVGRYLADSHEWPNWNEGNEFRALRDRQR